ncbi:MAG: DUF5103 domain-containing protein [Ekhidna sp.]|nr:DUF5103 domain-containing protein [Ekhidna sp.]
MKKILIIAVFLPIILSVNCEPVVPQKNVIQKQMIFDNYDYEDIVGNVILGPLIDQRVSTLDNPVINLNENGLLGLNFDLLTDQFETLSFKIIHCNKDWNRSQLRDMEFLNEINNFRITDFNYSVNTIQPYINYQLSLPKPLISGNYILAVFRRTNSDDLLLTRRFMVYETIASIDHVVRVSTTINRREENQQVEFSIDYGNLLVNVPSKDISPVILQNHNWYTAIRTIPPTLILANEGVIEYRHLDLTTNISGWNEFRFMDLRTLSVAGRNISKIMASTTSIQAILGLDKSRASLPYTLNFQDINGRYILQNNDPGESLLNADYAKVQFNLKSDRIEGNVYVIGRFNNWRMDDETLLKYNPSNQSYSTHILLKQGYYDYLYAVEDSSKPSYQLEGSHFETENEYEIMVYYRKQGTIHDEIIGYKRFGSISN